MYPTQLYASAALFLIFAILRIYGKRPHKAGFIFVLYLVLAPAQRFVIEFFRADHYATVLGLSVFQFVCLLIFLVSLYFARQIRRGSVD